MNNHPAAELFPMMDQAELRALSDDIKKNGLREAITTWEGEVLDGRNRLAACHIAKMRPAFDPLDKCPSPIAYVLSKNLHRRHLKPAQKAAIAVKAIPIFKAEAKERQKAGKSADGKSGGRGRSKAKAEKPSSQNRGKVSDTESDEELTTKPKKKVASEERRAGEATTQAAKATGASRHSVEALAAVERDAPEVLEALQRGIIKTVEDAKRVAAIEDSNQRAEALMHIGEGMSVHDAVTPKTKEDRSNDAAINGMHRELKSIASYTDRIALAFAGFKQHLEALPGVQLSGIEFQTSLKKIEWCEKALRELAAIMRSRSGDNHHEQVSSESGGKTDMARSRGRKSIGNSSARNASTSVKALDS